MAGDERAGRTKMATKSRKELPLLLASNRKLRHLTGISVRNLTVTPNLKSIRAHAIGDEAIPSTLKSAAKALAQQEKRLEHSYSAENLRPEPPKSRNHVSESKDSAVDLPEDLKMDGNSPISPRARIKKAGRRGTLEWSTASPQRRQKQLEDIVNTRMEDSFFSLHVYPISEPFYISEEVEESTNPSFRSFDLNDCGPTVTRLDELTLKLWAKNPSADQFQLLLQSTVNLGYLTFLGKSLNSWRYALPSNCILFYLTDGVYASPGHLLAGPTQTTPPKQPRTSATGRSLTTASYNLLMQLSTLDDCVQDALATREKLAAEIDTILQENRTSLSAMRRVAEAEQRLERIKHAVETRTRHLEATRQKVNNKRSLLARRKEAVKAGREAEKVAGPLINQKKEEILQKRCELETTKQDMTGQRRRICEEILRIYPIEAMRNRPLSFTIKGLHLPNSDDLDDVDAEVLSAALGYTAQVVQYLSYYLSVPLPYPLYPFSSNSTVEDPISIIKGTESRTFPLFAKGAVRYRFEFGVFLLNKDIEILLGSFGLRILDIRQTLPNLKYLLYVATAGKGELPARKVGGIRGLLRWSSSSNSASPTLSRVDSIDSNASDASGSVLSKGRDSLARFSNGAAKQARAPRRQGSGYGSLQIDKMRSSNVSTT